MLGGTVGDQDWLTLVAWAQPHLVYTLPCQFNVQTDQVSFTLFNNQGSDRIVSGVQHVKMGRSVGEVQELPQSYNDQT